MILSALELEHYKQYRSERIEFPERGIVGVIGANGVGKTTLFEAIEWCLFAPREIGNAEVPPRGGLGMPAVRVTLFDPESGVEYVVERGLRRGNLKSAEIYRADDPSAPIVQGTIPVTRYVEQKLIGLSRQAFVATFFTRQKELSFFGSLTGLERLRAVSRLLGLEAIRDAQKAIGAERSDRQNEATLMTLELQRSGDGRDFEADLALAEAAIAGRGETRDAARLARDAAVERLDVAQARFLNLQALKDADSALRLRLEEIAGRINVARHQRDAATRTLLDLARKTEERAALAPLAADTAPREAALRALEAERTKAGKVERLRAEAFDRERVALRAAEQVQAAVADARADGAVPMWVWTAADAADPASGARRLLGVVDGLDLDRAKEKVAFLEEGRRQIARRDEVLERQRKFLAQFRRLLGQRDDLLRDGDPEPELASARNAAADAQAAAGRAEATVAAATAERDRRRDLLGALERQHFDDACPTCARPIGPDEAVLVADALREQIAAIDGRIFEQERLRAAARRTFAEAQTIVQREEARKEGLAKLDARLSDGKTMVSDVQLQLTEATAAVGATLRTLSRSDDPTAEEVDAARARTGVLLRIAGTRGAIAAHGEAAARAGAEHASLLAEIDAIGEVAYDAAAHAAAADAYQAARDAAARLRQLDAELSGREEAEASLAQAEAELEGAERDRAAVEVERLTLAFDPAALEAARSENETARLDERSAEHRLREAETALDQALRRREQAAADRDAHAALRSRQIATERDAGDLQRMYGEFGEFEQFVAGRLGPQIAETAGDLIERVTSGKYGRVDFGEDYGLRVFDGDECFPIESFSGGERDVFALCARLALSRVIGRQALNRPRFLVLDEVFGSLDQDRRSQLLDVLGQLAQDSDDFRQLFIVSHVEDVQSSPYLEQVWRVVDVDGESRVEVRPRTETVSVPEPVAALGA